MKLQKFLTFLVFSILLLYHTGFAENTGNTPVKKRIAVLNFSANNIDESLARIVRNNIELNLFELGQFEVLEHDQVDFILQERKLLIADCADEECATKIGEMLSAEYVILGSVSRLDKYIVQIKVIDAGRKQLIIADKTETEKESDLRNVSVDLSNSIAEEIQNIGRKENSLFFHTKLICITPFSYLKDKVDPGFGIAFSGRIEDVFFDNLLFGLEIQYLYFNGKSSVTHHAFMLPAVIFTGYKILVWELSLVPVISGGITYNSVYYYSEYDTSDYSKDSALEAIAGGGINIEYNLTAAFHITASSMYNVIFEKDGEIKFMSYGIGAGMRF